MKKEVMKKKEKQAVPQRTLDRFETNGAGIKIIKRPATNAKKK